MVINAESPNKDVISFISDCTKFIPEDFRISDINWKFAMRSIIRGKNLLILGDSGCGKTKLANSLAKALDRKFFYFNMGATQDARSTLIGNTHFSKEDGTFVAEAHFIKAIKTPGAIVFLDEMSRAHPDAHNILMTALDYDQRYVRIDENVDTETVKVAENVSFVMTANVGSEYTATRTMDRALLDRCTMLLMPNLSYQEENNLLTYLYPELNPHWVHAIAEIADYTRKEIRSESTLIDTILSTRNTVQIGEFMMDGFSFKDAAEVLIYPLYPEVGGGASPRISMQQKVQVYLKDEPILRKDVMTEEKAPEAPAGIAASAKAAPQNSAKAPFPLDFLTKN